MVSEEGGVRIEWRHGVREVRLVLSPRPAGSYVYFEGPAGEEILRSLSPRELATRLDWLVGISGGD